MNVCIDIGNTLTKVAVFENDALIHLSRFSETNIASFGEIIQQYHIQRGIISSVRNDNPSLYYQIEALLQQLIILNPETRIPVINDYETPETLGKDRLAAVIGANYLYPGRNILVVDAGSAITFDFINDQAVYKGGTISPGLSMRFKALHQFTSRLPLLSQQNEAPFMGRNTTDAIVAGVQNSILFETKTYISELEKVYHNLITLVTGGDANFFEINLKSSISVAPNLVLSGLNRILNFNA